MLTLIAFIGALAILIAVHEYGHYRVAVACGVKVLRFSIGFGKPLLRWQPKGSSTEFVLAAFPLGGFVRMLDEREAPVDVKEQHRAFNRQSVWRRIAIARRDRCSGAFGQSFARGAAVCAGELGGRPGAHGVHLEPAGRFHRASGRTAWR